MDNPGVFLIGFLGFFFLLWIVGGGPHKPISFSGPFITPITNVGQTDQTGYGPPINLNTQVSLPGKGSVNVSQKQPAVSQPAASPYAGSITMARTTVGSDSNPNQTYVEVTLTSHASSPIALNGWRFYSASTGGQAEITKAMSIQPGQVILVVTSFSSANAHDTLTLYDATGAKVTTASY